MKQKWTYGCWGERMGGEDWSVGLTGACHIQETDQQQGLAVQHGELYLISCDKPYWKRI